MTSFYWVDTYQDAQADAAAKGVSKWTWLPDKMGMSLKDVTEYQAVYMRAGIIELERGFARIMREDAKKRWLC